MRLPLSGATSRVATDEKWATPCWTPTHRSRRPGLIYAELKGFWYSSSCHRLSDIAHVQLFQHFLLTEQELRHIEGTVQLLLFKFVAKLTHLTFEPGTPSDFAHLHPPI